MGPISMVLFDYGSRMPSGYFHDSFNSITWILEMPHHERTDECGVYVIKNSDTNSMVEQIRQVRRPSDAFSIKEIDSTENPLYIATMEVPVLHDSGLYKADDGFYRISKII